MVVNAILQRARGLKLGNGTGPSANPEVRRLTQPITLTFPFGGLTGNSLYPTRFTPGHPLYPKQFPHRPGPS